MNATQEPSCPNCGQAPEHKLREYIPDGTTRLTGIYYCDHCLTVFPYPPVHGPNDAEKLQPPSGDEPASDPAIMDLTSKRDAFLSLIRKALAKCKNRELKPVTRLDVVFDLTTGGVPHVWIKLDTHPTGEPDSGSSETYVIVDTSVREWAAPCHVDDGQTVKVISQAGVRHVNDESSLYEAVGVFFIELITAIRDAGELRGLPRGAACYLGVGAYDGTFGWPAYEDRGPANMF